MKKESNGTTIVKNFMKSQGSVFIILLVMCIIASIFTDKFLSVSNLSNVLAQSVTCGIAAIGMTFVILTEVVLFFRQRLEQSYCQKGK